MASNLILLGAPGSGKGTQAEKLAADFGLTKISTGDLIRDQIARQTSIGLEVKSLVSSGALVSDDLIFKIFREALQAASTGFIADGFPRTLTQAQLFKELLDDLNLELPKVLFFDLNLDVLMKRILGRRTCPKCNKVYNIHFDPPVNAGHCNNDGEALKQREDDQEAVIKNRYTLYQKEIQPVLAFYGNSVIRIDADQSPSQVNAEVNTYVR